MTISKEAKIGGVSIIIIFLLYWGINFLKGANVFSSVDTYYTMYDDVEGLEVSSPVIINGMKVGTITKVDMNSVHDQIEVEFNVKKKYSVPSDSEAELTGQSLLGGKQIVVNIGRSANRLSNGSVMRSKVDTGLSDATKEVANQARTVIDSVMIALSKANQLLSNQMIEDIQGTISNLNATTKEVSEMLVEERKKIIEITNNVAILTERVNDMMPQASGALENISKLTDSMTNVLPSIASNIDALVEKVNSEGSVLDMLMTDKELYDNATTTMDNASKLLEDLKNNPKRYVHFSIFGKRDKSEK